MTRARWLLLLLLICQAALLIGAGLRNPLFGDEPYYVAKAKYFFDHLRFERASAEEQAIERGERWGDSDWRPQGYPLFLAAIGMGDFDASSLRPRVTAVQFVLLAAAVWLLFESLARHDQVRPLVAAALLGGVPWPYDDVALLSPDSLTASVTLVSVLLLWRSAMRQSPALTFAGALLLSSTALLRPEMIALAPVILLVAGLLRNRDRGMFLKRGAACAGAFVIVVAAQVAYRYEFTGRGPSLFGGLHISDGGPFAWVHTWLGTENEAYNFVYGLRNGQLRDDLPARAFSDDEERRVVRGALRTVRERGYGPDIDAAFQQLAEKRKREHPFVAIVATRLWHTVHLWVNVEMNGQLLQALAHVPRMVRRPILGGLVLLKLALLALFLARVMRVKESAVPELIILLAAVVIGRTLLIGLGLNWMVHRYVLMAWLPLVGCAATARLPLSMRQWRA
jgi:hypothetical protein